MAGKLKKNQTKSKTAAENGQNFKTATDNGITLFPITVSILDQMA